MKAAGGVSSDRNGEGSAEGRQRATVALIESHDAVFRRTARRYSICADDAEDAYQRALEILLTKAPPIEGDPLVRWMQVVTKREALAVRRQRERILNGRPPSTDEDERDPLDLIAAEGPGPTDRAESRERIARSSEALRALKPQEVRALTLKAEGYSYAEIGEITGWTYTKINRCMAEGRKRFLQVFAEIEQGRRCGELSAALSAFADGEQGGEAEADLRAHLRGCGPCRAKLRAFRAIPDRVLELAPVGPAIDHSIGGRAHEWLSERAGAAVEKVREAGYSMVARGAGDGAGAVAGTGGTRGAGMAALGKVLAVCGATAAGSATCVATGVIDPGAVGIGAADPRPAIERPAQAPVGQVDDRPASSLPVPIAAPEQPPSESPAQQAQRSFSFEQAAEPVGGGGEFGGPAAGSGGGSGGGGTSGFGFER